jgi:hypothetical protein
MTDKEETFSSSVISVMTEEQVDQRLKQLDERQKLLEEQRESLQRTVQMEKDLTGAIVGVATPAPPEIANGDPADAVPECMYCPVLSLVKAKTLLRDVIALLHNSPSLKNAVARAKAEGGGQQMVLKHVNPVVMKLQLDIVSEAGFEQGPRGAAQFGLSLNRYLSTRQ